MEEGLVIGRSWWSFLLRGIIAIAFGIILLAYTGATVKNLTIIVGLFAMIDGIVNVVLSIVLATRKERWGWTLAWGLFGLLLGAIIISHPGVAVEVVAILAGIWAVVVGIAVLALAFDMPPMSGRGAVGVLGVLSIIIGIVILVYPFGSVYALSVLVAIYALIAGVFDLFLSFYVKRMQHKLSKELKTA